MIDKKSLLQLKIYNPLKRMNEKNKIITYEQSKRKRRNNFKDDEK
jgi:hypothetical protein